MKKIDPIYEIVSLRVLVAQLIKFVRKMDNRKVPEARQLINQYRRVFKELYSEDTNAKN